MTESEPRPRAFVPQLIQPGDIVLTTTPARMSRKIRAFTGANISHAMVCVTKSSVIDSTGDGVHARNLERIVLEAGCAGHVLRPLTPLTADQLRTVISWARAAVGTRYTMLEAGKSVLAGFVAGRRQFCSRLVAQAYREADVHLVSDADFCHPGELLRSPLLVEVPDVLRELTAEQEAYRREAMDHVEAMRESTNALLRCAREMSSSIESLNDIDAYLIEHLESDDHLVEALKSSRYLELWRDEFERNAWQYNVALMEGHDGSTERKRRYCEELLEDEKLGQNRFVQNHAGYVTLNATHPRQYFALKVDLYDLLASLHARRVKAATEWLERRELIEPVVQELLRPHTPEWFESLRTWNPMQAAQAEASIQVAGSADVCTVCADDPALDYELVSIVRVGPGTIRLCDFCFKRRSAEGPMRPF